MESEIYAVDYQSGLACTIRLLLSKGLLIEDAEDWLKRRGSAVGKRSTS